MNEYFKIPKPRYLEENVKAELDLSIYATKEDLKNATGVDTSKFIKKFDLASLKSEIDKLDIDKLETTQVDLSKLSDVVKNEVVKKTYIMNQLKESNANQATDTTYLFKKADFNTNIDKNDQKILDHDHDKYITT